MERESRMPVLLFSLKCLTFVGLNPYYSNPFYRLIGFFGFFGCLTVSVMNLLQVPLAWNGFETLDKINFSPSLIMGTCKFAFMIKNRKRIVELIDGFRIFWPLDKFQKQTKRTILEFHNFIYFSSKAFAFLIAFGCAAIMLSSFVQHDLPFPAYHFCDYNVWPCFEAQKLFQAYNLFCQLGSVVVAFDTLFLAFVFYSYSGLEVVKSGFREINNIDVNDTEKLRVHMRELIEQHNVVLWYIKSLNKIYSGIFLIQFWSSLGALIFSMYKLTSNGIPPSLEFIANHGVISFNLVCQLGIYCFGGEIITSQALSVPNEAFLVNWQMNTKLRADLAFIIMRSQRTQKITVGNMTNLNNDAFVNVLRNALSTYTLLYTISETK